VGGFFLKFCDIILRNERAYYSEKENKFSYFKTKEEAASKGFVSTKEAYEKGVKEELDAKFKKVFTI
jgi:hypothetical protein